jgi:hypothetical protein
LRENFAEDILPWVFMVICVGILTAIWLELYLVNVNLIQTGVVSQVNRNIVLNKVIIDYSGLLAALIVAAGVVYRAWTKSVPLLVQEIVQKLRNPGGDSSSSPALEADGTGLQRSNRISAWKTLFSAVFKEILLLGRMGECEDFQQWLSHFLIMWGFIGLGVTTALDGIVNFSAAPLPIISPVRLLGNITGIMFAAGLTLSIARRIFNPQVRTKSQAQDWVFLISLYGTALTGFAVQIFADTGNVTGTWLSYPTHLAFIAFVLISAPWTKFIHALWRPSWIVETRLRAQSE